MTIYELLSTHTQSKASQCLDEEDLSKIELALRHLAEPGPAAAAGVDPDDLWINYDGFTQVSSNSNMVPTYSARTDLSEFCFREVCCQSAERSPGSTRLYALEQWLIMSPS